MLFGYRLLRIILTTAMIIVANATFVGFLCQQRLKSHGGIRISPRISSENILIALSEQHTTGDLNRHIAAVCIF